jgi:lysophospholipase L1-like esterase
VIPVLFTNIPSTVITTTTDDNARLGVNTTVLGLASATVLVGNMDTVLTDGASPARIKAGLGLPDGVHPNTNGAAVMAPVMSATLAPHIP